MIDPFRFLLGALAVWRITHLLHAEDGPWDLLHKMRRLFATSVLGRLLDCFYCLSLWVAVPFAVWLGTDLEGQILLLLSLSAGAIVVQRLTAHDSDVAPSYFEPEDSES